MASDSLCNPMTAARQASLSITNSDFTQTHYHWIGDAIQPSHPLSSPSPPIFNLSQHQGLFKWVSSSHQVAKVSKVLEFLRWKLRTLATWCEELTHWKRPWCWERLKARGEGDDRGWDGWMASPIQWTWVWVNSGSWWWTGRPGVLQSLGS